MTLAARSIALARIPTPLVRLERLSARLGAEIWCKRDDLTGIGLSGNKVRKLEYLFADAARVGADTVLTTGGIQSNHARATAVAARQRGLEVELLLRGEPTEDPDGNLLIDHLVGAALHWCTPDQYRHHRDEILADLARECARRGRVPYVIPEGGSNAIGAQGYASAAKEVAAEAGSFDGVVVACGSGGTVAGLALGPDIGPVHGIAVCDDGAYFRERITAIARDCEQVLPPAGARWDVLDGWQGPAYAVATPEIWETIRLVARTEGLLLDPVYTGKAMHALVSNVRAGVWGGRLLFWHTGGVFGLFGRGGEAVRA